MSDALEPCSFCVVGARKAMQNLQSFDASGDVHSHPNPAETAEAFVVRIGARVRVRRQRWAVVDVRAYQAARVVTLRGLGPLNFGETRRVVSPFEAIEPLERQPRLRLIGRRRWQRECRALIARAAPAGSLSAPLRARIDLLPFQLEPALAIVRGLGTRVLIADEVGLGKTIQAALIVLELRALGAAERVLMLTPAGLRDQWSAELHERFGLDPLVVDVHQARRQASRIPVGTNPWTAMPLAIVSIDYAKRPEVLPAVLSAGWDVVIVDEAHGVGPGSDRYEAVDALCAAAPYVVLLTATPHSGDRLAFGALCRIGAGCGARERAPDKLLVFRRTRREVMPGPGRRVHCLAIRSTADGGRMHERLAEFTCAVDAEHTGERARLALATLHKRAMSSAHSLHVSVIHRQSRLADGGSSDAERQLTLPLDEGDLDPSDDLPAWTVPALADSNRERRMLDRLRDAAARAAENETKLTRLTCLLRRLAGRGEPAIVFTEYRDTLQHVAHVLASTGPALSRIAVLHGGLSRAERSRALADFQSGRAAILLATDAGGEGLNLQAACRVVINLELPWNPMRLEQRIGRVDRIGQSRRVHAFNLIGLDSGETRVLSRLKARIALARQDVGAADPLAAAEPDTHDEQEIMRGFVPERPSPPTSSASVSVCPDQDTRSTPADVSADSGAMALTELRAEGEAELARLLFTRRLLAGHSGDPSSTVDSVLTFARRPAARGWLSSRLLVLLVSSCEDGAARPVAARVTPLAVRLDGPQTRRDARGVAVRVLDMLEFIQTPVIGDLRLSAHAGFWAARLARERTIEAAYSSPGRLAFQPGLFDHRAEAEADERKARHREAGARIALLEASAALGGLITRAAILMA